MRIEIFSCEYGNKRAVVNIVFFKMKEHGTTNIFTPLLFSSLFRKGKGAILMPRKKGAIFI